MHQELFVSRVAGCVIHHHMSLHGRFVLHGNRTDMILKSWMTWGFSFFDLQCHCTCERRWKPSKYDLVLCSITKLPAESALHVRRPIDTSSLNTAA